MVCLLTVQYAILALPTERNKVDCSISDDTAKPVQTPKSTASSKPKWGYKTTSPESESPKSHSKSTDDHLVLLTAPLDFPSGDADLHFSTRPTYHFKAFYKITATMMRSAHCLLDTRARVKLIRSSLSPINWAYHIKPDRLPTLCIATKQQSPVGGLILINLSIGNLNSRVWSRKVPQLAVDILLSTAFTDRLIRVIFPSEQKIVTRHSRPEAITTKPRTLHTARKTNIIANEPVSAA